MPAPPPADAVQQRGKWQHEQLEGCGGQQRGGRRTAREEPGQARTEREAGQLEAGAGGEELAPQPRRRLPVAHREERRELRPLDGTQQDRTCQHRPRSAGRHQQQPARLPGRRPADHRVRREHPRQPGDQRVGRQRGTGDHGEQQRAAPGAAEHPRPEQRHAGDQHALARAGHHRTDGGQGQRTAAQRGAEPGTQLGAQPTNRRADSDVALAVAVARTAAAGKPPRHRHGAADQADRGRHTGPRPGEPRDRPGKRGSRQARHVEGHRVQRARPGPPARRHQVEQLRRPTAGECGSEQARPDGDQQPDRQVQAAQAQRHRRQRHRVERQRPGQQPSGTGRAVEQRSEDRPADRRGDGEPGQQRRGRRGRSSGRQPCQQQGRT
ncbi:hypothetical protein OG455_36010 [Kitasatospora sp. NBC_01287]|nr:hypothetical protein [Kitasatospora sp. NBC_01287]